MLLGAPEAGRLALGADAASWQASSQLGGCQPWPRASRLLPAAGCLELPLTSMIKGSAFLKRGPSVVNNSAPDPGLVAPSFRQERPARSRS